MWLEAAGAVAHQHGMSAWCNLAGNFFQMFAHGFAVGGRHDDGGADGTCRTQGAEQVDRVPPVVARGPRT